MNVKRFTARNSRDALNLVRQAFGEDAVVLSTQPCLEGVEVLAMAPDAMAQIERVSAASVSSAGTSGTQGASRAPARRPAASAAKRPEPALSADEQSLQDLEASDPGADAERLAMSTLSFQDYVRERMLRRRKAEIDAAQGNASASAEVPSLREDRLVDPPFDAEPSRPAPRMSLASPSSSAKVSASSAAPAPEARSLTGSSPLREKARAAAAAQGSTAASAPRPARDARMAASPVLHDEPSEDMPSLGPRLRVAASHGVAAGGHSAELAALRQERLEMMSELRSMKGLIEERFKTLAFLGKLQQEPRQTALAHKLMDCGFSPALVRKLVESLPAEVDEAAWAAHALERNLHTGENELPLEDQGGVYALVGTTGVGKTTSTAKLAAAFAARHGAANLGLITLDAYRVGAHEQLRAYGRILGVPVHTAHDRASLEDLLDLLSGKRMVLIDTAGMPQRDNRTRELLEMVSQGSVRKLLVVNASAQGETIEDVLVSYRAAQCHGVVLSKLDEAVKAGPALDAMIRHKLKVLAVGNGQRVPEDWHRLSSATLVQRALCVVGSAAWRLDADHVNLVFSGIDAPHRLDAGAALMSAGAH